MKSEKLFEMLGNADDELVEKALCAMKQGKAAKAHIKKSRIFAAAALVAVAAAVTAASYMGMKNEDKKDSLINHPVIYDSSGKTELQNDRTKVPELYHHISDTTESAKNEIYLNSADDVPIYNLPCDYLKIEDYLKAKYPEKVWEQICLEFEEFYGMKYDDFIASFPEGWELDGFCSRLTRQYKNADSAADEYKFHDYVFVFAVDEEKTFSIAMCKKGNPVGQIITDDADDYKYSIINDHKVMLVDLGVMGITATFNYDNINYYSIMYGVDENDIEQLLSAVISPKIKGKEMPSDANACYHEAVTSDMLTENTEDIFCGAYIDENGKYTVLLTDTSSQNIKTVCESFGIDEKTTVFKKGEYTLLYLSQLQEKITDGMINREFPFVWSSGVYEDKNRVVIRVEEGTEEGLIQKVLDLDTIGGAILTEEMSGGIVTYEDIAEITTYVG